MVWVCFTKTLFVYTSLRTGEDFLSQYVLSCITYLPMHEAKMIKKAFIPVNCIDDYFSFKYFILWGALIGTKV